MIRLFVGLDLPEDIKEQLYTLRGGLPGATWRTPDKMHMCLRFIGNVEEPVADDIIRELRYIRFPAFHLGLKQIGYFETGDIPHHLWTGVDRDSALTELQEKIDAVIKKAGGGNNDRFKFMPHVTLAKLQGTSVQDVFTYIARNNLYHSPDFLVDSFALFASHARDGGEGKHYSVEEVFPLSLV